MNIDKTTLPSMADVKSFKTVFESFCIHVLGEARLFPLLSPLRVEEAHGAWQNDLHRVGGNEPNLGGGLDHFKQCGHLAFWVRRMSPVIDVSDLTYDREPQTPPLTKDEVDLRNLLFGYHNEFIAFEFGYQFCLFYELEKPGGSRRAKTISLSDEYYKTTCHFLKYKNVSPHALFLIYKSLFYS